MVDNRGALEFVESTISSDGQEILREEYKHHIREPIYESAYFPYPMVPPPIPKPAHHRVQPSFVPILPLSTAYQRFKCTQPQRFIPQHEIAITANSDEDDAGRALKSTTLCRKARPVLSQTKIVVHNVPEEKIVRTVHVPVPVSVPVQQTHVIQQQSPSALPPILTEDGERRTRASVDHLAKSLGDMFESIAANVMAKVQERQVSQEDYFDRRSDDVEYRSPRRHSETRWPSKRYSEDLSDDADNRLLMEDLRNFIDDRERSASRRHEVRPHCSGFYGGREKNLDEREESFLDDLGDEVSDDNAFRTRSTERNDWKDARDELSDPLTWICTCLRNLMNCQNPERQKPSSRIPRAQQRVARITELVDQMTEVSRDVIKARTGMQRSGLRAEDNQQRILAAEARLWKLIDLENQLADELSNYRLYDLTDDDDKFLKKLLEAEDKLRLLIEIDRQCAHQISISRKIVQTYDRPGSSRPSIYGTLASKLPSSSSVRGERSMPATQTVHMGPDARAIPAAPEIVVPPNRKMTFCTRPIPQTSLTQLTPLRTLPEPVVTTESPSSTSQSLSSSSSSEVSAPGVAGEVLPAISDVFPSSEATQAESTPPSSEFTDATESTRKKKEKKLKKSKKKSKSRKSKKPKIKKKKRSKVSKRKKKRKKKKL